MKAVLRRQQLACTPPDLNTHIKTPATRILTPGAPRPILKQIAESQHGTFYRVRHAVRFHI